MLASLKGHSAEIVGHDFVKGRVVVSVDRAGYVNVWDWKISTPLHAMKLSIDKVSCFVLHSNKEGFVVASETGVV